MKNSKSSAIAILGGWEKPEDHLFDDEPEETLEFTEEDIRRAELQELQMGDAKNGGK